MEPSDRSSTRSESGSRSPRPPLSESHRHAPSPARRASANDGGNASGRSRPRASLACMNCRQRKIKCKNPNSIAGVGPGPDNPCMSCRSLRIPCVVSRDGDRRKAGSREQVTALQDRLQFLESLIMQNQSDGSRHPDVAIPNLTSQPYDSSAPESGPDSASGLLLSSEMGGQHPTGSVSSQTNRSTKLSSSRRHVNLAESADFAPSPRRLAYSPELNSIGEPFPNKDAGLKLGDRPQGGSPFFVDGRLQSEMGHPTPPSEKDTTRLELDESNSRPCFYGPTSQLHIQRRNILCTGDGPNGNDGHMPTLSLDSTTLRNQLFATFWRLQPNSVVIVEQSFFEAGQHLGTRSEYYSPFLENSLLACATRMSTSGDVRDLGSQYAERAKVDIVPELEDPNIATLQGFLLLSDFEATRGRDRLGYSYCGIGCRLVFDLGLPESCDNLVTQGKLAPAEALWRHTLLLGTFVFDKLWSLYLGRPSAIPCSNLDAAHQRSLASGWTGPTTLGLWVGLCTDMSEVTDILNSIAPLDSVVRERLADLDVRIQQRSETLPMSPTQREIDLADLPINAYGLYIQFYGLRIVLHRLLSRVSGNEVGGDPSPSSSNPRSSNLEFSRVIMHDNALRIARLMSMYYQICGIENVITVMLDNMYVAAVVLISHLLRLLPMDTSAATQQDLAWLRFLADMLQKAQKHYPVTARMRATLSSLVENTSLAGIFGSATVRPNGMPSDSNPGLASLANDFSFPVTPSMDNRQEVGMFEDCFGENGDRVYQEMDMRNMMSWAVSPATEKGLLQL